MFRVIVRTIKGESPLVAAIAEGRTDIVEVRVVDNRSVPTVEAVDEGGATPCLPAGGTC